MQQLIQYLNTVSPMTLVATVVILIVVIAALVIVLVRQNHHIKDLEYAARPKYGFLGKTLPVLALVLLATTTVSLSVYLTSNQQGNVSVNADKRVDLNTTILVRAKNADGTYPVEFKLVPKVDGTDWDIQNTSAKFDAFWDVTGTTKFSQIEYGLNVNKQGGFVKNLPVGTYKLSLGVLYLEKLWQKTVDFTVP